MAALITLATAGRNAACDAIVDLVDAGGTGGKIVITDTAQGAGSVLATVLCALTAYGSASVGVATLASTPLSVAASGTGTIAGWKVTNNAGTTIFSGTAATSAAGTDLTLSTVAVTAALNAIRALLATPGTLQMTVAADTTFASPRVAIPLAANGFAAASGTTMALSTPINANATVAGTLTLFRIITSGAVEVLRGTVGTAGEDINLNNNVVGIGSTITVTGWTLNMATAPSGTISAGEMIFAGGLGVTSGETVEVTSGTFTQPA